MTIDWGHSFLWDSRYLGAFSRTFGICTAVCSCKAELRCDGCCVHSKVSGARTAAGSSHCPVVHRGPCLQGVALVSLSCLSYCTLAAILDKSDLSYSCPLGGPADSESDSQAYKCISCLFLSGKHPCLLFVTKNSRWYVGGLTVVMDEMDTQACMFFSWGKWHKNYEFSKAGGDPWHPKDVLSQTDENFTKMCTEIFTVTYLQEHKLAMTKTCSSRCMVKDTGVFMTWCMTQP